MMMEIVDKERDLLKKILDSYLSELRLEVAATKRSTHWTSPGFVDIYPLPHEALSNS